MNTDFLKSLDELSQEDKSRFALEEAFYKIDQINNLMKTNTEKAQAAINERLATGNCYLKDDIIFERRKDGDKAIYFPKGNAVEYQVEHGLMPASFLKNKQKLQSLIDKRDDPDSVESEIS